MIDTFDSLFDKTLETLIPVNLDGFTGDVDDIYSKGSVAYPHVGNKKIYTEGSAIINGDVFNTSIFACGKIEINGDIKNIGANMLVSGTNITINNLTTSPGSLFIIRTGYNFLHYYVQQQLLKLVKNNQDILLQIEKEIEKKIEKEKLSRDEHHDLLNLIYKQNSINQTNQEAEKSINKLNETIGINKDSVIKINGTIPRKVKIIINNFEFETTEEVSGATLRLSSNGKLVIEKRNGDYYE